jgi:hypothetical protein
MSLPGFIAESALTQSQPYIGYLRVGSPIDIVLLQDCPWYKRAGCVLGPFSWCVPASFGGAVPFWNCVDKVSGGNCLDCIGTSDPRDTSGETGGGIVCDSSGNCRLGPVGSVDEGLTSDAIAGLSSQIASLGSDLKHQLNQIERCACKFNWLGLLATLVTPGVVTRGVFEPPTPVSSSWPIG